jgi:hypothetical protein
MTVPRKTFGRLLDTVIRRHDIAETKGSQSVDFDVIDRELVNLEGSSNWPWNASHDQIEEWNSLHRRLDP